MQWGRAGKCKCLPNQNWQNRQSTFSFLILWVLPKQDFKNILTRMWVAVVVVLIKAIGGKKISLAHTHTFFACLSHQRIQRCLPVWMSAPAFSGPLNLFHVSLRLRKQHTRDLMPGKKQKLSPRLQKEEESQSFRLTQWNFRTYTNSSSGNAS